MKKFTYRAVSIITILVLAVIATVGSIPGSVGTAYADTGAPGQDATVSKPGAGADPDRIVVGTAYAKPGIYYMDYGYYEFSPNQAPFPPFDGAIRFFTWADLNPTSGNYNWAAVDDWLDRRTSIGLGTGIFLSTYDGYYSGDIRGTPDYVIKTPNAVLVVPTTDPMNKVNPGYVDYYRTNGDFDNADHRREWVIDGGATVVSNPPVDPGDPQKAAGWAGKLGGAANATDRITRSLQADPRHAGGPHGDRQSHRVVLHECGGSQQPSLHRADGWRGAPPDPERCERQLNTQCRRSLAAGDV